MMRAVLIATSLTVAVPCFAQQVRVISGNIEHVYGPGGELLDDAGLQARNKHAWEQMQAEKLAIERRKSEALAYAPAPYSDTSLGDSTYGGWSDGGGFIGSPTRGFFFRRGVIRPRIGISQRMGGSPRMGGSRR